MPVVWIPSQMRDLTHGRERVSVAASTVRHAISELDVLFPGLGQRLLENGDLKPHIAVVVDGEEGPLGLAEALQPESELHFLPAISGGCVPVQSSTNESGQYEGGAMMEHTRRSSSRLLRLLGPVLATAVLALGCGPGGTDNRTSAPAADASAGGRSGPKEINIAMQNEWPYIVKYGFSTSLTPGPDKYYTFHNNLTIWSDTSEPQPRLAQKVPSLPEGDWKVNPDGTMEVTWKLRPDVTWHDGTPLTAQDFLLGLELIRDSRLTLADLSQLRELRSSITALTAPDPQTLVVSWGQPYILANSNDRAGIPAVPRHQVEPLYRSLDTAAFEADAIWTDKLIGLGPYKMARYERGSFVEATAFDGYFLGRPKIDKVTYKFVGDPQVQVAQFLAGSLDIGLPGAMMKPNQLISIRDGWGPGKGQVFADATILRVLHLNFRLEDRPWGHDQMPYATDKRFRQAMLHAMNREQLSEVYNRGFTTPLDYLSFPQDPVYVMAERANVPKFRYDPRRAQQIFSELGWTKGQDGLLRNSAGQTIPFPCCRRADSESENIQESLAWGQDLKEAGINVIHPIPLAPPVDAAEVRRLNTLSWGGFALNYYPLQSYPQLTTSQIGTAANRYTGSNNGGWSNRDYDDLVDLRSRTLPLNERQQVELRLLALLADENPFFPVYMNPLGMVARDGIIGFARPECTPQVKNCVAGQVQNDAAVWNMHTWDLK